MSFSSGSAAFGRGLVALAPLTPGVIPFGLITGVMAVGMGLSPAATLGMTVLFFSGSAQLVALQLMAQGSAMVVVVMTALIINLRFIMYSASLAPFLHHLPRKWTWPLAYLLSDQAYAVSLARFSEKGAGPYGHCYYAGTAVALWVAWTISVMAGVYLGATIPDSWSLTFTIPLSFLALLVPSIRNRACLVAAIVGGALAVLGVHLPYNLGLILAALGGVGAGVVVEHYQGSGANNVRQRHE